MRKEDKLRPYRIDYFNIEEMKESDLALVRSVVLRSVTAEEAEYQLLQQPEFWQSDYPSLVVIRSYRFYKKLGTRKKDVYKAVEDLFTANRAVAIMDQIEAYRAKRKARFMANEAYGTPSVSAPGHVTRYSDSSLYDEVCVNCGATDTSGKLNQPCPSPSLRAPDEAWTKSNTVPPVTLPAVIPAPAAASTQAECHCSFAFPLSEEQKQQHLQLVHNAPATSGTDSLLTKAVVTDLQGMIAHDTHEQAMDTFVPTNVPEGKTFPDPTNVPVVAPVELAPVPMKEHDLLNPVVPDCPQCEQPTAGRAPTSWTLGLGDPVVETPIEPDQAVGPEGRPGYQVPPDVELLPLWAKMLIFSGVLAFSIFLLLALLHR